VYANLFDEQAEEFFRLFGTLVAEDLVELVCEAGEGGRVRRRVRLCGEPSGKLGFLFAERLQAFTVATDAFLAERG
jgi:hypothetical protein